MEHDLHLLSALRVAHRGLNAAATELTIAGTLAPRGALANDCHLLARAVERELQALSAVLQRNGLRASRE